LFRSWLSTGDVLYRFEAGTDTTAAALSTFIVAAISYPDALKSAQAELDRVCGDRSPTMAEFEQCEYVRAMCKETLRWRTVTAGGTLAPGGQLLNIAC